MSFKIQNSKSIQKLTSMNRSHMHAKMQRHLKPFGANLTAIGSLMTGHLLRPKADRLSHVSRHGRPRLEVLGAVQTGETSAAHLRRPMLRLKVRQEGRHSAEGTQTWAGGTLDGPVELLEGLGEEVRGLGVSAVVALHDEFDSLEGKN